MNNFHTIILVIQVLSALTIVALVLLQHGKGADMGAAFGSGASGSLFGASGSSNFLSKSTGIAAAIFFVATLGLAFLGNRPTVTNAGVMENLPVSSVPGVAPSVAPTTAPNVAPASDETKKKTSGKAASQPSGTDHANQIPK